jgi:5-methylcytosine-specific restriction endonuclease McrA
VSKHHDLLRNTAVWRRIRLEVIERDGHACTTCGSEDELQVHHVNPISKYPELALEPSNLLTLCGPCNRELGDDDPNDATREPWLHPAYADLHDLVFLNANDPSPESPPFSPAESPNNPGVLL